VNCPTTRDTTPAADPRTGRRAFALPRGPGLDRLLADPNLGSTAKTIATALVKHWAWFKDSCWPSDRTIAQKVGKSPGHVQRCLRQLENAGYILRQRTDEVPTGRLIWLTWRCPTTSNGARGDRAPAREGLSAPARDKRIVVVTREVERGESAPPERQRPEPIPPASPTVPVPRPNPPAAPTPVEVVAPPSLPPPAPQAAASASASLPMLLTPEQKARQTKLSAAARGQVEAVALPSPPPSLVRPAPRSEVPTPASAPIPSPALPLTPEQLARLDALPAASRDQVLIWLATGDPILVAEARKRLGPPRPRPEAPRTLPEVLARIREDPSFPALAADWLASALDDRKSWAGFKARCEEAWRGELPVDWLLSAYAQATGPRAKKPGALFMHALHRRE
jgi:hypothetical protein